MTPNQIDFCEWINQLALALEELSRVVTAVRWGLPDLTNEQYRSLAREAENNPDAQVLFSEYIASLDSIPPEVIEILRGHPIIQRELAGSRDQEAIFMVTPTGGFRVDWKRLSTYLSRTTIKYDAEYAAQLLHRYLLLSENKKLPGHEITLFRGLIVDKRIDISEGVYIAAYKDIVDLGLIRQPQDKKPWDDFPDYIAMDAAALVRDITWGPGVTRPPTSSDPILAPKIAYAGLNDRDGVGIALHLLSITIAQNLEVLSSQCRGAKFMEDLDPNFQQSTPMSFRSDHIWEKKPLSEQDTTIFREFIQNWLDIEKDRDILSLAIMRLAASLSRRGYFGLQDSILDLSIVLEILYTVENPEVTYKLATRAAYYLGEDATGRNEVFEKIQSFYKIRSRIVHGRKQPKKTELKKAFDEVFKLARRTLLKTLKIGRLDDGEWNQLVVSGPC